MTPNRTDYLSLNALNPVDHVVDYISSPAFVVYPVKGLYSSSIDQAASFVTFLNFHKVVVTMLFLSVPFIFNYIATWLFFWVSHLSKKAVKVPPAAPYMVPFLGSTYHFAFNGLNFVRNAT